MNDEESKINFKKNLLPLLREKKKSIRAEEYREQAESELEIERHLRHTEQRQHARQLELIEAAYKAGIRTTLSSFPDPNVESSAAPSNPNTFEVKSLANSLAAPRQNTPLNAAIKRAIKNADDPNNWGSAWITFVELAQQSPPHKPLLGYIPDEGVKYETDSVKENGEIELKFLSKSAFGKKLRRANPKNPQKIP